MAWYTAHIIMLTKFKDGKQDQFPIWENLILIEADSDAEAAKKAERRAKEDEGDAQGSYTYAGRPATWVCAGIRKITRCVDAEQQPENGSELSYSEIRVDSAEALAKLVQGKAVRILYESSTPPLARVRSPKNDVRRARSRKTG